jgi:hypothetical protein
MEDARHAKKDNFKWGMPVVQPEVISYDPPKDDFYKARISTLERENRELREEIEKRAEWYGMGKDAFDERQNALIEEIDKLRTENTKLRVALINAELRNV